jgi:carboxyl-terminal processing protease
MENNTKYNFIIPTALAVVLAIGLWVGNTLSTNGTSLSASGGAAKYQKMQDIIDVLDKKYVDTLNGETLFEQTISDMLHKLDPHSYYIPAKEIALMNESIEGQFGGIGVRFFILRDTICVTNVITGSPSSSAGLKAGDKIIQVDGKQVAKKKFTNDKVMSLLKGKENTAVSLRILRNGKLLNKRIIRGTIPIESVVAAYMIAPTIGYVKIESFSVTTAEEFKTASLWLKQKGMKKIILDLRNNGGGVLQTATAIADEFLSKNVPIVMTKGQHTGSQTYRATAGGLLESTPVAILINSNSASASEILAGAIQDNDRGTIIGRRSFGKGLVQEDIQLRDGSNLRLTIARYYTPTGRCIQKPYDKGFNEYMTDQIERYDNGELYTQDSTTINDSLKYKTPKGKIVYGGGGIMPDVFVAFDSSGSSWYFTDLRFSQSFSAFAFDFVQNKRSKWSSIESFDKTFTVSDDILNQFVRFAEKEIKVKQDKQGFTHSKALIAKTLKAEIARQLWLEDGYFRISNKTDNEVQRAVKLLKL